MIDWLAKLLFKISPKWGMKYVAKKMGVDNPKFGKAHDVFKDVDKIDIHPFKTGRRGFVLVMDGKVALYFAQEGNHFKYEGYEMGSFKEGDVTLFDNFRH